jgi:hypothetical protein
MAESLSMTTQSCTEHSPLQMIRFANYSQSGPDCCHINDPYTRPAGREQQDKFVEPCWGPGGRVRGEILLIS